MTRMLSSLRRGAWTALLIAALTPVAPAVGQTPFEAAAIVNDMVVTEYDVAQRARLLTANGAPQERARELALDQLIADRIRTDAARADGLTPTDRTVEAAFADYASQRGLTADQLDSALRSAGIDRTALEEALIADISWREFIRRRFGPRAEPTESEIDQELAIASAGQSRSLRLQEIVLPFSSRGEDATRAFAEDLARRLRAGGDFDDAARRLSASPSAANGGDVGWVPEAALPLELADALSGAAAGAIAGPLPAQGGVVLVKVNETREDSVDAAGQDTLELALVQDSGSGAQARVARIAQTAATCEDALTQAEAAGMTARRSEPTPLGALQPLTRDAVAGLSAGENSGAIAAQGGVVAFFVCSRLSGASPEAREALRQRIRNERLQGFAAGYLQELRGEAVIEIR